MCLIDSAGERIKNKMVQKMNGRKIQMVVLLHWTSVLILIKITIASDLKLRV